jgi:hypothetical protein
MQAVDQGLGEQDLTVVTRALGSRTQRHDPPISLIDACIR